MRWATFSLLNVILCLSPGILLGAELPDLVITDIIIVPKPPGYGSQNDVIINTKVRNNGGDALQGFNVWCHFHCGERETHFSGMNAKNGLKKGQEITLGDNSLLSLSACPFATPRKFECTVDRENYVTESDKKNNSMAEFILTGR